MKKIVAGILAVIMILALFIPALGVFAAGGVDEDALELFLNKLATMSDEKREFGALVLEEYFADGDDGIDELKDALDTLITDEQKESLEKYGYSVSDVKRELNRLKDWSDEDRAKLVSYIENGNESKIKDLILKNESSDTDGTEDSDSIGDAGDSENAVISGTDQPINSNTGSEVLIEVNFTDIGDHWAKDSIEFLAKRGIITGRSLDKYDPQGKINRAEFTALIVRLFNLRPQDDKALKFNDMNSDTWYYEAVKAAYDNGIINGINVNSFGPNESISREQMVSIIVRILEQKDLLTMLPSSGKDLSLFTDKEQLSSWAINDVSQAIKYGLLSGRSADTLAPKDNTTRAEAATIVMKLYSIINN